MKLTIQRDFNNDKFLMQVQYNWNKLNLKKNHRLSIIQSRKKEELPLNVKIIAIFSFNN